MTGLRTLTRLANRLLQRIFIYPLFCLFLGCGGNNTPAAQKTSDTARTSRTSAALQILVADWANHRVVRMDDMQGNNWTIFGYESANNPQFEFPISIGMDSAGRVYVAEQRRPRIVRFDNRRNAPAEELLLPGGANEQVNKYVGSWIFVDELGKIFVTYDGSHRIVRVDDMQGTNWIAFGSEGSGTGQFRYPAGVWVDANQRIYIADFDNFRIVRIDDMHGANWTTLGSYGSGTSEFVNPCGIWGDQQGRIYVADQGNDRIVRFDDMQGTNWTSIGSFGTSQRTGTLYAPSGICVDPSGRIYVSECSSNHRIVRMDDMTGANWTVLGTAGTGAKEFASPMGIFVR